MYQRMRSMVLKAMMGYLPKAHRMIREVLTLHQKLPLIILYVPIIIPMDCLLIFRIARTTMEVIISQRS